MQQVTYRRGFPDTARAQAAALYDQAFGRKLGPAIPDQAARLRVLTQGLDPRRCIAAMDGEQLVGIAGFHDAGGSLTGGITAGALRQVLGWLGSARAIAVFALLHRTPPPGVMLMDGIVVDQRARGRGIGTGLFAELERLALSQGLSAIRLDVVDTNPGARALYERLGFCAVKTTRTPFLRRMMGFSASTTMDKALVG